MSSGEPDRRRRPRKRKDRNRRIGAELDAELAFHCEKAVEDLMRGGMERLTAEKEALLRFGDVERYRRRIRRIDRRRVLGQGVRTALFSLGQNIRHAFRRFRRTPVLTVCIVFTLALGIGVNATMFGIVDRLLLAGPPHVQDPERVRQLHVRMDLGASNIQSFADYQEWKSVDGFQSISAYSVLRLTLGNGEDARDATTLATSGPYFRLLGVQPALGRFYDDSDRASAAGPVVLSYHLWQTRFGGDRAVLGRSIELGKASYRVIGVAPAEFMGVDWMNPDAWVPLNAARQDLAGPWETSRRFNRFYVVVRLRSGKDAAAAEDEATARYREGHQAAGNEVSPQARVVAASIVAANSLTYGGSAAMSQILAALSVIVLLIACSSVANLLLARGVQRRSEIALRLALGIGRKRLVAQSLLESSLLALLGGAAAILVSA